MSSFVCSGYIRVAVVTFHFCILDMAVRMSICSLSLEMECSAFYEHIFRLYLTDMNQHVVGVIDCKRFLSLFFQKLHLMISGQYALHSVE